MRLPLLALMLPLILGGQPKPAPTLVPDSTSPGTVIFSPRSAVKDIRRLTDPKQKQAFTLSLLLAPGVATGSPPPYPALPYGQLSLFAGLRRTEYNLIHHSGLQAERVTVTGLPQPPDSALGYRFFFHPGPNPGPASYLAGPCTGAPQPCYAAGFPLREWPPEPSGDLRLSLPPAYFASPGTLTVWFHEGRKLLWTDTIPWPGIPPTKH